MEWKTAFEELKQLSVDSSFGVVSTFSIDRDLIDIILNLKRLRKNLLLFLDDGEQFVYPYSEDYKIITKQQLPSLDSDRNLHLKLYLFGKKDGEGAFLLNCLIGSCNATGAGLLRNVEFWGSTSGRLKLPTDSNYASIIDLFEDSNIDPSLAGLEENCLDSNGDKVIAPAIDLLWRLVRDSNGVDSGLEFGRSSCLSDKIVKKQKSQNAIFVHSFGDNSLKYSIENMITQSILTCQNQIILYLISPYYTLPCLDWIVRLCEKSLGHINIKIEIRLLTDYPPDYQERYLTESFDSLENLAIKDKRVTLTWKLWTNSNKIEIGSIIFDQTIRDISSAFIHGKALVINNDDQVFEAIVGSANLTSAAISLLPNTNLEGAIWERTSDKAKSVFKELTVFWNAATEQTQAMLEQLNRWKEIREDVVFDQRVWVDAKEALKKYIQVATTKHGQRIQSRNVNTEELDDVAVELAISDNSPKINLPNVKCVWLPNLDSNLRTESILGQNSIQNALFKLQSQPISKLFYKVTIPTKFLRETSAQIKKLKDGKIVLDKTFLTQGTYCYALSGKASHGWVELDDYVETPSSLEFTSTDTLTKSLALRVYDRQIERELSVGWDYVTITKKRPILSIDKSCVCQSAFCFLLKENPDRNAAELYPKSVEVTLEQTIQVQLSKQLTNRLSKKPYEAMYSLRFLAESPVFQEIGKEKHVPIQVKLRFLDENYLLRRKSDLYANLECEYLFKDSKICAFNTMIKKLEDYSSQIVIKQYPLPNKVVDKAPITLDLDTTSLDSDLAANIKSIFLDWEILLWGRTIKGKALEQKISYPSVKFNLTPEMLAEALGYNIQNLSFEGSINIEILAKANSGWLVPLKKFSISVSKSDKFIKEILAPSNLWNTINIYIRSNKRLFEKINQLLFNEISQYSGIKNFDSFVNRLSFGFDFEPIFGNKDFDCKGFGLPKSAAELIINLIAEDITEQFIQDYYSDKNTPSLPQSTLMEQAKDAIVMSLRKTTLQVEDSVVVFPNLILRKINLDPMPHFQKRG